MWVVYILTDKGWSEDERFDTEEQALAYKEEWLEEHPSINEDQFKVKQMNVWDVPLKESTTKTLATLTPREENILREKFGIGKGETNE